MSYISQLNLLNDEPTISISEESLTEELSLWANAQFTFDTKPGTALPDDSLKASSEPQDLFLSDLSNLGQTNTAFDAIMPYLTPTNHSSYLIPTNLAQKPSTSQTHQPSLTPVTIFPRIAPAPTPKSKTVVQEQPIVQKPITQTPKKRKQSDSSEAFDAAEDDKRRRNTAASARFRMKKKLREQALEKTAKEMTVKAEALEKRVKELEMEAKWLRALVVEKDPALLTQTLSQTDRTFQ